MSEKEKDIIRKIALIIPKLSKEKQNYILGVAEGMAITKEEILDSRRKELQEVKRGGCSIGTRGN